MKVDDYLTWSQIYEKVDELLGEDEPRQRHHKFPWAKGERKEKTVEVLPHGARRINMNWDWEDDAGSGPEDRERVVMRGSDSRRIIR